MHSRERFQLRRGNLIRVGIGGKIPFIALLTAVVIAGGCSYRMAGQQSSLPESYRTIAITVFENDSFEPNLENAITLAVTQKFIDDGRLRVVGQGKADLVLTGTVKDYDLRAVAFDEFNYATLYSLNMGASVTLKSSDGSDFIMQGTVSGAASYSLGANIVGAERARLGAIDAASNVLAANVIGLFLEGF